MIFTGNAIEYTATSFKFQMGPKRLKVKNFSTQRTRRGERILNEKSPEGLSTTGRFGLGKATSPRKFRLKFQISRMAARLRLLNFLSNTASPRPGWQCRYQPVPACKSHALPVLRRNLSFPMLIQRQLEGGSMDAAAIYRSNLPPLSRLAPEIPLRTSQTHLKKKLRNFII